MRKLLALAFVCAFALLIHAADPSPLVSQVSVAAKSADFTTAARALDQYKSASGVTPEYLEALSWVGRGQLTAKNYAAAIENAQAVRTLCLQQLKTRTLQSEPSLATALGASIEVQGQAAAADGRRDEAVAFLREEVKRWNATPIHARIAKNLNLISLEGTPAIPLDISQWIGAVRPQSLDRHRGHPVLMFFWAHWCPDCRAEIPIIAKLRDTYGPRGLHVIGPTQHYGYVAGGEDAPPAVEAKYIGQIFSRIYTSLNGIEAPLSERNFRNYGVSNTPTIVVLDAKGLVRLYNPGSAAYEKLAAAVETALRL